MTVMTKKIIGISALGALALVDLAQLQQADAAVVSYTGASQTYSCGNCDKNTFVGVTIGVDGASGTYRMTTVAMTTVPTGNNRGYANLASPTLISEALAAQSAKINTVSGATAVSAAWITSLSSAIAASAAAGQALGSASVVVTPTPTPTSTVPGPTPTGTSTAPGPVTSPGGIPVPYFAPLNFQSLIFGSIPNFSAYLAQISSAQSSLNSVGGSGTTLSNSAASALSAAKSALNALRSQVQSEQSQYASIAGTVQSGAAILNSQFAQLVSGANQAIADYYSKVQNAAATLYSSAVAAAAAIPTPTVTVMATVTATVTAMVTVTATPPTPQYVLAAGAIKKTYTCVRTLFGVTTTKVLKALVVKCPLGFKLKKVA